jgi:hypothetical protein
MRHECRRRSVQCRHIAGVPRILDVAKTFAAEMRISGWTMAQEFVMRVGSIGGNVVWHGLATLAVAGAPASQAMASQGPGTATGGATATTQLGMAILVYGLSSAVVIIGLIIGLIGALRQR